MDLPAGFLTLILTDIAGSTAAWDADPEAADAALQHHDGMLAKAVADNGGLLLKQKGEGDSTFSVFEDAVAAVSAAVTFLARLERDTFPLPVRVALHSGDLVPRGGDYYGPVPNRAARLRSLADGYQVLLSATTAAAVRDRLPSPATLVDLGEHELRGLSRPEHVHGVSHPDLRPVAPIGEPAPPPGNVPAPIDRFVGRDEERILLDKALRQHRLVTVVGPGGIGKSRLALQVAAEQAGEHPSGTWVVDLADLDRPEQIATALAALLELGPSADDLPAVAAALARPSLVVLDTCEAQLDGAAAFAEQLLRLQPRAVVLATSREPLGAQGEAVLRLEPMTLETGARELFLTRAAAADLTLGDALDDQLVARICAATDGVPLAIELVAGRLAVEQAADIDAVVEDLDALLGPDAARRRTGPARQRTLGDTIAWSVDGMSETERSALVRLTVFAGGWPHDAAADVCADTELSPSDVARAVQSLARRSLVVVDRADRERFRLLDTVRETVRQRYGEPPDAVRDHHLSWATAQAEAIENLPASARRSAYAADRANLRVAFAYALATDAADHAHRLVYAQANVWAAQRAVVEARAAADAALALGESPHRDAALAAAAFLTAISGDLDEAERLYAECSQRDIADPEIRSDVWNGRVMIASIKGSPTGEFVELATQAVAVARAVPHSNALAIALNNLAVALNQDNRTLDEVMSVVAEGATVERVLDAGTGTRLNLAVLLVDLLRLDEAEHVLDEIRAAATDPINVGIWWDTTAILAAERGRPDELADALAELLRLLDADAAGIDDDHLLPLARLAAEWGYVDDARRLRSHADDPVDAGLDAWLALRDGDVAAARAALGDVDPSASTWWFSAIAAEVELADGHPERVADLLAPALAKNTAIGRRRAVRRLERLLGGIPD